MKTTRNVGHLGEDNTSLGEVLVENPDFRLISGVLNQCGQYRQDQPLPRRLLMLFGPPILTTKLLDKL